MNTIRSVPWYRQAWPWLVVLPPAVAVIGGLVTVYLAFSHADPEVCGPYVREAFAAREATTTVSRQDCSR
jgi:hypothetical protein